MAKDHKYKSKFVIDLSKIKKRESIVQVGKKVSQHSLKDDRDVQQGYPLNLTPKQIRAEERKIIQACNQVAPDIRLPEHKISNTGDKMVDAINNAAARAKQELQQKAVQKHWKAEGVKAFLAKTKDELTDDVKDPKNKTKKKKI